jgi:hypothetical protein
MSYRGLEGATSADARHLGGSIKVGDPFTYCPTVWNYVINRFSIESVLDLGSGCGNASWYFHKKGLKVIAVDGFHESVMSSIYPSIQHDITVSPVITRVGLVHCHEVVEHIEEQYLDNLLTSLMSGKFILMTHATPGQDGYHHVNCQPSEYWISHLQNRGCRLLEVDSERIKYYAKQDGASYMKATGMIFVNSARE